MAFHLWDISELFSNASGSVQFIELTTNANGESFWQGQTITATQGGVTHSFTFPNNLPSTQTAGRTVLIATEGFAALGLVTPDYVVPNGFLFTGGAATVDFGGVDRVNHGVLPSDGRTSIDRGGNPQTNSPRNFAGQSGSVVPGPDTIEGGAGNDTLTGTPGADRIEGKAGNDTLNGLQGDDRLDGGSGIDSAIFSGNRAAYTVSGSSAAELLVSGPDGSDRLQGIERLRFADGGLAFDLGSGQSAGNTVRVIGAAFDAVNIVPAFVGIGLQLFDAGQTMLQVCQLAIDTPLFRSLAGSASNTDFVNLVYRNVVGVAPTAAERDFYVGLLQGSGGTMTQAELLVLAAEAPVNAVNVDLVGLAATGVGFG